MIRRVLPAFRALVWCASMLPAASWGQETTGYLLDLPPGARAIGMGSAQGAVAEGPDAGYWNPAALAFIEPKHAVAVTYSRLKGIEDYPFVYAAYATPIPKLSGTIAASFAYFDLGEQEDPTTGESYRPDELAPAVAYGGRVSDELAAGIGVKMYRINYSRPDAPPDLDFTATTVLIDGGILWRGKDSRLLVGGTVQNLGPDLEFGDNGQSEPPARNLKLSLGSRLVDLEHARLVVASDLNILLVGDNQAPRLMVGGEMQVGPYAAMRIGLRYDGWFIEENAFTDDLQQYATTLGFGVRMKGIAIDYANAPWVVLSQRNSHHISVGARF